MKVWSGVFNIIGVWLLLILLLVFYQGEQVQLREFEELHLRFATDYATEAAFRTTLDTEDIEHVYWDMGNVSNNPTLLLQVFKTVFARNYDISTSEENFAEIESYIPTGVLLTKDGFYSLKHVEVPGDVDYGPYYGLKWSLKHPYLIEGDLVEPGGVRTTGVFAAGLPRSDGENNPWKFVSKQGNMVKVVDDDYPVIALNDTAVRNKISELVTEEVNYNIYTRNNQDLAQGKTPQFYLPSKKSMLGINSVERPTLIMFVQNVNLGRTKRLSTVSLGGTKVVRKRMVAAFREGTNKYYCYETQLPKDKLESMKNSGQIEHFYDTIEEAAMKGYSPHLVYLTKPLVEVR